MQRLNNSAWPFGAPMNSSQTILNPAQFLMVQQQLQQTNNQQNFDLISAYNQQQQQQQFLNHQQLQQRQQQNQPQLQKTSSPMLGSTFSSPFSVNSLLNSGLNKLVQQQANQQIFAQHSNNQQLAAAMLTQHLAAAMANYRMQQQQLNNANNQQRSPPTHSISDSAFQAPAKKKQKLNESSSETTDLIQNSSICSISSPSSSSTSSSSACSSSSISFDYHNPDYQTNHLDYINTINNHNNKSTMDSNVSISLNCESQTSLNESHEFLQDEQQFHQSESERNTPISYNFNEQKTPSSVRRSNRKRVSTDFQTPCCPICGVSLRVNDLQAHLDSELEKLEKVNSFCGLIGNDCKWDQTSLKRTSSGCEKIIANVNHQTEASNSRHMAYARIKENRQQRIKNKLRLRMKENQANQTHMCPLCNESIAATASNDQINIHLENCPALLLRNDLNNNKDCYNDLGGSTSDSNQDSYETYEWAGQKRIRAMSMLQNHVKAIGATNVKKEEFEGELVNVDYDEREQAYGKPQFNESDLIPIESDGNDNNLLRQAVIGKIENIERQNTDSNECEAQSNKRKCDDMQDSKEASRCLICMEAYTSALVSVNCWHVHCKSCWLQSLGAKKLCPQCNVITSPNDLRRIFL